jgi:surface antigen
MRMHRVAAAALAVVAMGGGQALAASPKKKPINEDRIWQQRWSKASEFEQQWAYATGECESGNVPTTATGNGYLGSHQFDEQTWWAAPDTGQMRGDAHQLPHLESWKTQAVVAIKYRRLVGEGPWPRCG